MAGPAAVENVQGQEKCAPGGRRRKGVIMTRTFVLKGRSGPGTVSLAEALNPQQLAVATAPSGPMLVIAGAGSGKTRALTYRLAWLVENGVDPSRILLATFTNRAAREMLARVETLVHQETRRVWGGTFHHIANRLLRLHGRRIGISPDFSILDREDARDLLGACVSDARIPLKTSRFPQKRVLVEMSSAVQNMQRPLEQLLTERYPMFARHAEGIQRVLDRYGALKRERQLLDYDDLLGSWLRLLQECPDLKERIGAQFLHILVDEYQDTNAIQGAICDALAERHRNICVVGDDAQSIYSFRGAEFANILRFKERYPDAREYRLETNYRSSPEILALANSNIACNRRRLPKTLSAVRPSGLKPAVVRCHDHFVQSRFIAEYILHLIDQGRNLEDIGILYRSHWHSLEIQLELQRHHIPYHVRGGLRFFEQAHIKDVLAFLRIVHNPRDELAWLRTLKMLPRVGTRLAHRLWQHIARAPHPRKEAGTPAAAAVLPKGVRRFYAEYTQLLERLAELKRPADMIRHVLESFYDDYRISHFDNARLRREDIKGMIHFADQYRTVDAFLTDVALAGEFSGENVVTGPEENTFVVLSTVHQAKGLEWSVVMIPWLADGRFPTDFAINTIEEEEEERRVFHVAVTRAKDELYLVVPQIFNRRGSGPIMMKPSRFIMELGAELTEPLELDEGLPELTVGSANA